MDTLVSPWGHVFGKIHPKGECLGEVCPIHKPSNHPYKYKPLYFNGKHMIREASPGRFVIDPDDLLYRRDGEAIIESAVSCLLCGTKARSIARHDLNYCMCGHVGIDGGYDYQRILAKYDGDYVPILDFVSK